CNIARGRRHMQSLKLAAALFVLVAPAARVDRVAAAAKLVEPFAVAVDRSGNLYICEYKGQRVTRIDPRGAAAVFAGAGLEGSVVSREGASGSVAFKDPHGLVIGSDRQMYVADTLNHRVVKLDLQSRESRVIAGTGQPGFSGDGGPAERAEFNGIYAIDIDRAGGRLYVAALGTRRIRAIELPSGTVRTIAGNGAAGAPEDGADAAASPLVDPRAVAVDSKGNVYVLERRGNALRRVDANGKVRTLLGPGKGDLQMN